MEGKSSIDPRKLAHTEYMMSKDRARFTSIAQKLAQHINHLAEDKNSRIRWIWELIQNAKDVPNQFGRCRIRIEIKDDKLIFAHNGDPFRVSDLQSLVAQYSSKAEENKINTETTGKYGTGFIVTYILSKKVRIKGLLTMKTPQEQNASKNEQCQDQDEVRMSQQEQISNTRARQQIQNHQSSNEAEESLETDLNIEDHVQNLMPKKSKLRNFEGGSLYQRFEILLDREYKDRDTELVNKLMMTQQNLMDDLLKNEPQPKWQRKEGQLNTQFIYEDIDEAANKMINESMVCLKQLFPYALLFNPKLFQIQVIDKRTYKSLKKFGIKKLEEQRFNGLKIFNANILEEGEEQARKFSLAYIDDQDTYSTVAMPLQIRQNYIKLLEVNNKMPKIFKQFPLIGCKDTGFNFVFTSKRFYPNQSRSNLLLQQIQGRDSKKTRANWQAVTSIFQKGLQLYKTVARIIDQGQQNMFIISLENQFVKDFPNKNMIQIFKKYQDEISQVKCIQFNNKSFGSIQELTFPFGESQNKKIDPKSYCSAFNSVFSIILGEETTLNDEKYVKFYPKFAEYKKTWQKYTSFADVSSCVSEFSKMKFQQLVYKVNQNKDAALKILQKIYEFLSHNHPNFLLPAKLIPQNQPLIFPIFDNKKKQPLNFILTNQEEFKNINANLMIKKQLPPAYEEVGQYLGININGITIHDRFIKYFSKLSSLGVTEMLKQFENKFYVGSYQKDNIVLLGRFITTFNIKSQALEVATKLKYLQNSNKPFEIIDKKNILVLQKAMKKQYQLLFQLQLMNYINKIINNCEALSNLMNVTVYPSKEEQKGIEWLNSVFKLEDVLLRDSKSHEFNKAYDLAYGFRKQMPIRLIDKNLSLSKKFVHMNNLKVFCLLKDKKNYLKGNYPDNKDIEFYQKMKDIFNRRTSIFLKFKYQNQNAKTTLKDFILHESIQCKLPSATTFKNQFQFIIPLYNFNDNQYPNISTTKDQKIEILNYIYHLRQSTIKNRQMQFKINVFHELEKIAYFEFASLTKRIQKTQNQIYAFCLMRNQAELAAAREIAEKFGSMKEALEQMKAFKSKKEEAKQ